MSRLFLLSPALVLGIAGTGFAQPLYLGELEFDTGDRDLMAAIVDRCSRLAEEDLATAATEIRTVQPSAPDQAEASQAGEERPAAQQPPDLLPGGATSVDTNMLAIQVDGLSSGGGKQGAAGEGADEGAPPAEGAGERKPELSAVTLQFCREAGVVF